MIINLKEETQKLVFNLKENVNKQMSWKKIQKKKSQMSEVKHTIQDLKEEINKDIEPWKMINPK
jgi:argininosuccinate synthase